MAAPVVTVPLERLREDFASVFDELYGEGDLVWVNAGEQRFLLVNGADEVREVMVDRAEELVKPRSQTIETGPPTPENVDRDVPAAIFRQALAKGMGTDRTTHVRAATTAAAATETAGWQDGLTIELMPRVRRMAIRSTVEGAFGSRLDESGLEAIEEVMRFYDNQPQVRFPTRERRFSSKKLREGMAAKQHAAASAQLIANADLSTPTLLTAIVQTLPELLPSFGPEAQKHLAGELLVGAAAPLTQTIGWMLLRSATETGAGNHPADAFVREVTRLHPTNPRITRAAVVDTTVAGEHVPAHTRVILNVNGIQRDARFYEEPERFSPERWVGGRANTNKFAYISFGIGGRRCRGEDVAMTTLTALLPGLTDGWRMEFGNVATTSTGRRQLAENTRVTLRKRANE